MIRADFLTNHVVVVVVVFRWQTVERLQVSSARSQLFQEFLEAKGTLRSNRPQQLGW